MLMEGKIRCRCGNEIFIYSDVAGKDFEIRAEGGRIERKGDRLLIICGKCGNEAGKINFFRQVPMEKK